MLSVGNVAALKFILDAGLIVGLYADVTTTVFFVVSVLVLLWAFAIDTRATRKLIKTNFFIIGIGNYC